MVFFLWSGFEGKGGTRRKTVAFSSFGLGSEKKEGIKNRRFSSFGLGGTCQ